MGKYEKAMHKRSRIWNDSASSQRVDSTLVCHLILRTVHLYFEAGNQSLSRSTGLNTTVVPHSKEASKHLLKYLVLRPNFNNNQINLIEQEKQSRASRGPPAVSLQHMVGHNSIQYETDG